MLYLKYNNLELSKSLWCLICFLGGKKKPLKAPKKQSKEMDDVSVFSAIFLGLWLPPSHRLCSNSYRNNWLFGLLTFFKVFWGNWVTCTVVQVFFVCFHRMRWRISRSRKKNRRPWRRWRPKHLEKDLWVSEDLQRRSGHSSYRVSPNTEGWIELILTDSRSKCQDH